MPSFRVLAITALLVLNSCGNDQPYAQPTLEVVDTSSAELADTSQPEAINRDESIVDGESEAWEPPPDEERYELFFDLDLKAELLNTEDERALIAVDLAFLQSWETSNFVQFTRVDFEGSPGVTFADAEFCAEDGNTMSCGFDNLLYTGQFLDGVRVGSTVREFEILVTDDVVNPTVTMVATSHLNTLDTDPDPSNNVVKLQLDSSFSTETAEH